MVMASIPCSDINSSITLCKIRAIPLMGSSVFPLQHQPKSPSVVSSMKDNSICQRVLIKGNSPYSRKGFHSSVKLTIPRSTNSSNSSSSTDESSSPEKTPFGYSRKDVLLIGLGVTLAGVGLKSGLEFFGVDPLQAGNVVQLVMVLGLTVGWISTYIFRVSNKEMTYAQQLRDYEVKVMQKRLDSLTEAELESLLEQVEEEKTRLTSGEQAK